MNESQLPDRIDPIVVEGYLDPTLLNLDKNPSDHPYLAEWAHRSQLQIGGMRDIEISGGAALAFDAVQFVHESAINEHITSHNAMGWLEHFAAMNIDWRVFAALASVYAVKSAGARLAHSYKLNEDMVSKSTDGLLGREPLTIGTQNERRRLHLRQRAARTAAVVVGGLVAWKGAEHATNLEMLYTSIGSLAVAVTGAQYARHRAVKFFERLKRDRQEPSIASLPANELI